MAKLEYTTLNTYMVAAKKGADWLVSNLKEDGSYGTGAEDLACYYKGPYALSVTGHLVEATRMLDHIERNIFRKDGDFGKGKKSIVDFIGKEYYTYPNAWIVIGAQRLGRFNIAYKGMSFILKFRDTVSGGFFSERSLSDGGDRIDTISTSFAGVACLYTGHLREAQQAGDSLIRFLKAQPPDRRIFYTSHLPNGEPITKFPEERAQHYVLDAKKERQWYFFVGYPVGFLSKLYSATGDQKYLRAAEEYFTIAASLNRDVYQFTASGKLAWGSAVAFKITRNPKYRRAAQKISDFLLTLQNKDGSWLHRGLYSTMSEQPMHVTLDVTHEFVAWLAEVSLDLR